MENNKKMALYAVKGCFLRKFLSAFLLMCCITAVGWSQNTGGVSGLIKTTNHEPIPYVSVALQHTDGKIFKGALTDTLGKFSFSGIPYGSYKLAISNIGYSAKVTQTFSIDAVKSKLSFDTLVLVADAKQLNTVMITGQKKLIEQGMDKMTLNIENSILAEGNTALELLERAPGIKVDSEGKISLKGRSGVIVMINGKATYLSASELAVLLKGTNSSSISKIEIVNNPSAKYDAAGNAGMINIIMKKNLLRGFNGSVNVNAGAGREARYGGGFNLNYRSSKINLYGNYNYAFRGEREYLDFIRNFYNGQQTSVQRTSTNEPLNTHNFRFGIDLEIDSNNTIGFLVNGNVGKYLHDSKTSNLLSNNQNQLLSDRLTTNYDRQSWQSFTYNLNYQHRFGKKDRILSGDLDFVPNRFNSNLNLDTYTSPNVSLPNGNFAQRIGNIPSKTDVYVAKVDYQDPWSENLKFESGIKTSLTQADNDLVYHQFENNQWQYDPTASNHFKYKEQIHAGYVNLMATFGKTSLQAGLRGEYTVIKGNQVTTDQVFDREYFQLFPNLTVSRNLTTNHQLQLSYGRRIERPNYGSLNPFRVFRDPSLYYEGNPYLTPERTQNLTITHAYKSILTSTINYSRTNDVITWVTGQNDATNTTFETPKNLPSLVNYGISVTAQHRYLKWWNATNFANVFRNEYDLNDERNSLTSFSLNTQNSFTITKGLSAELNAFYNSKSVYGIIVERSYWAVSAALQKNVFGDKGSIKLVINDIFQTNNFRNDTQYQNINMYSRIWIDSRRAIVSFSYRFGKQLSSGERKTGSEDLQRRVK